MGDKDSNTGQVLISDLSDEDIMIKYCLNKVKRVAIDELLARGYDSLKMVKDN